MDARSTAPSRLIIANGGRRRERNRQRDSDTLQVTALAAGIAFPHAAQAIRLSRRIRPLSGGKWRTVTIYAITSPDARQATPAHLAQCIRGHWHIEVLHHIRDESPASSRTTSHAAATAITAASCALAPRTSPSRSLRSGQSSAVPITPPCKPAATLPQIA